MFYVTYAILWGLFAAAPATPIPPVDPDAPPAVRITIEASMPDGAPAAGVPVYEVGLERGYIRYGEIGETDDAGRFTVPFQSGREINDANPRGYGLYRYVLMPPAHRWEISDFYCWNEFPEGGPTAHPGGFGHLYSYDDWFAPGYDGKLEATDPANNWSYGESVPLFSGKDMRWPVRLLAGESVELTVVDQDGTPIADVPFAVGVDLRARTRTGHGGYIPITKQITDGKGRIVLEHVGDFAYNFMMGGATRRGYYAPDGGYYHWDIDHNFASQGTTLRFQRVVPVNLYFQVRDARTGKAVTGAIISPCFQFYAFPQTGSAAGTTREGEETLQVEFGWPLEHVIWFNAEAPDYERGRFMIETYKAGEVIEFVLSPDRD